MLSTLITWISISQTWICKLLCNEGKVLRYKEGKNKQTPKNSKRSIFNTRNTQSCWTLPLIYRCYIVLNSQRTFPRNCSKFLCRLHRRLTHYGSESENSNFREMIASLALFYLLKTQKAKTPQLLKLSKPLKQ